MKKGRPSKKDLGEATSKDCDYCEGTKFHWGKSCPACNGSGKELVRRQLQKVYNAEKGLPINDNIN